MFPSFVGDDHLNAASVVVDLADVDPGRSELTPARATSFSAAQHPYEGTVLRNRSFLGDVLEWVVGLQIGQWENEGRTNQGGGRKKSDHDRGAGGVFMQPMASKQDRSLSSAHGRCPQMMGAEKALTAHQPSSNLHCAIVVSIRQSDRPHNRPAHLACWPRGLFVPSKAERTHAQARSLKAMINATR